MFRKRLYIGFVGVVGILAAAIAVLPAAADLSTPLPDQDFWKLVTNFSEPDGTFHSENLVSNEVLFQTVIPSLEAKAVPGRAFVGVGSEQNFTFIAAVRPTMAFIVDIRRGNLELHLVYKAVFELSANRVEFVSKLFSRKTPEGLMPDATVDQIFAAFKKAAPDKDLYERNLKEIKAHLQTKHGFKLSSGDLDGIDFVYRAWFKDGPNIRYALNNGNTPDAPANPLVAGLTGLVNGLVSGGLPTYADLMTATDGAGKKRSYLATEDAFRFVKALETRNRIVPIVGNFGGPKALRAVGGYLKQQSAVVSAFYTSNVEQYLREDGLYGIFCSNVATFPVDDASIFVRSERSGFSGQGRGGLVPRGNAANEAFVLGVSAMKPELAACSGPR